MPLRSLYCVTMATTQCDIAVIGGGILGLATALAISYRFPKQRLVVLEKEQELALHQTGHNSGVIHSGIYYKPGSLKAQLCVDGARRLVQFCQEHSVPYELCGKLVVATSEAELPRLEELDRRGAANGVPGLEMVGLDRIRELEPHARGLKALWSPATGIVGYTQVAKTYAEVAKSQGVQVITGAKVTSIRKAGQSQVLETTAGDVVCARLINCAGLYSDVVARMAGAEPDVRIIPFRGEYYFLREDAHRLVRNLIYPVPDPEFPFLGVHFTKTIDGKREAGPNAVLALAREGYRKTNVRPGETWNSLAFRGFWAMSAKYWKRGLIEYYRSLNKSAFVKDLQRLVPDVQEKELMPGGSGVRAQAVDRAGRLIDDFRIIESRDAIHVLNAPSPAATASLAIGRYIADLAQKTFGL